MTRLRSLTVADDAATWASLGFAVADGTVLIGTTSIVLAGTGASAPDGRSAVNGFLGWELAPESTAGEPALPASVDGLPTSVAGGDPASVANGPSHPNGVVAIDHVVVSTPDVDRTVAVLEGLGLSCRRRREGAAYGSQRMRQAFFWLGDVILEVVGPETPDPEQADRPASFFGLALTCADLDATGAFLGERMKPPVEAVQAGRRISTISSKAGAKIPIALMSPHVAPTA